MTLTHAIAEVFLRDGEWGQYTGRAKTMKFAVPANVSWHTLEREMTFTDPGDSTSFLFKSALRL